MMKVQINRTTLELVQGDITQMTTDAIVNAATQGLIHGGGLSEIISLAGGPIIQQESNEWVRERGLVRTGSAAITSGGNLKARYVIHAVGPIYDAQPRAAELLGSAVNSVLQIAKEHKLKSITIPPVSTGIFGYPMNEAAHVMLGAVIAHLRGTTGLSWVIFCLSDQATFEIFSKELRAQVPRAT
ncbi:MAG: macro domain-containing protein [Chloroflexi bacterium]|nr:macro domain-containing protein [Chloroflexota bacterium]